MLPVPDMMLPLVRVVAGLSGECLVEGIGVPHDSTILSLKAQLAALLLIPASEQLLLHGADVLFDCDKWIGCLPACGAGTSGGNIENGTAYGAEEDHTWTMELALLRIDPTRAQQIEELRIGRALLIGASVDVQDDCAAVVAALESDGLALAHASETIRANPRVVLRAVARDWRALQFASPALLYNRSFMMKAVEIDWRSIRYAAPALRSDVDFAIAGVRQSVHALEFLKSGEKQFVLKVAAAHGGVLQHASKNLRADADIVLAAVCQDGAALQHASAVRRADRKIVLAAVRQNGRALQVAAPQLRADREIVLRAVSQHGLALAYAAEALQGDREVAALAVAQDARALHHVHPRLLNDKTFAEAAISKHRKLRKFFGGVHGVRR